MYLWKAINVNTCSPLSACHTCYHCDGLRKKNVAIDVVVIVIVLNFPPQSPVLFLLFLSAQLTVLISLVCHRSCCEPFVGFPFEIVVDAVVSFSVSVWVQATAAWICWLAGRSVVMQPAALLFTCLAVWLRSLGQQLTGGNTSDNDDDGHGGGALLLNVVWVPIRVCANVWLAAAAGWEAAIACLQACESTAGLFACTILLLATSDGRTTAMATMMRRFWLLTCLTVVGSFTRLNGCTSSSLVRPLPSLITRPLPSLIARPPTYLFAYLVARV